MLLRVAFLAKKAARVLSWPSQANEVNSITERPRAVPGCRPANSKNVRITCIKFIKLPLLPFPRLLGAWAGVGSGFKKGLNLDVGLWPWLWLLHPPASNFLPPATRSREQSDIYANCWPALHACVGLRSASRCRWSWKWDWFRLGLQREKTEILNKILL